jgi:hypothetical protein
MKQLTCPNKKCNYVWNYDGLAIYYTSCPSCLWRVRVNRTPEELEIIKKIKELEMKSEKVINNREEEV